MSRMFPAKRREELYKVMAHVASLSSQTAICVVPPAAPVNKASLAYQPVAMFSAAKPLKAS